MLDTRTLSIGVIGTGGMGRRHALNLHQHVSGAQVVAVNDFDRERAGQVATACGAAQVFDDPIALIRDESVEAVVIASPDPTHVGFTLECLRRQKPVLCEKPLATTADDAAQILATEAEIGRQLVAVGFMRRFDPYHMAVRQTLTTSDLGRAVLFKGVHRNAMSQPDVTTPTIVTNSASHDLDMARWLLNQEVEEVYARAVRSHASFSEATRDVLLIQMALSGDCLATIEVAVAVEYGYEVSAEIVAERGAVVTMQPDQTLVRARQSRLQAVPQDWLARFQDAYLAELRQWVDAVRDDRPFLGASAWDGYMAVLVADACINSLATGQPVRVPTPDKPDLYA